MPRNMPIRDYNRADTDPALAPFWFSSGMSAKYIKITFSEQKIKKQIKLMDSTFYNEIKNLQ